MRESARKVRKRFLEKIVENESGVENIKLVPTHGVVYPQNRRKTTVYMRVNSYCMTCRGCVSKESSASYIITIKNATPAVERPNYLNVKVVRRNEHQHKRVESNAPPSKHQLTDKPSVVLNRIFNKPTEKEKEEELADVRTCSYETIQLFRENPSHSILFEPYFIFHL
jgi:hypothetical protein